MSVEESGPEAEVPPEAFETRIVDVDFHMNPAEEVLLEYVDDGTVREKLTTEFGMTPRKGKWDAAYAIKGGNEGLFTQGRAQTPADVREAARTFAIDEPVVNAGINNLPTQHHPVLKNAVAGAANDWLLDAVVPEDLHCLMMLPQWDPEFAVEEIERVGDERGIVGAYGWFGPFRLFGTTDFDPVFEALEANDLPLFLHGSLSFWPQNTPVGDGTYTWTEILGFDWPVHAQMTTVNMIMSGVFDRFPDVQVVIQEGGHWWLPFLRYRMDEFYEMHPEDVAITPRKFEAGERYLDRSPSEYLRDNVNVCTQPMAPPDRSGELRNLLELSMAADTFLYSSDWPHQTLDPATWAFDNPAIDDELRDAILHGNAERLLGI
ncbi:amidohydrolase family protein [Halorarum halobium]|uniref:amidohydrolase family protein n=1 Tax=Halorarum halobium TaxID=3075121 RepID=UPI0028AE0F47|nr:amidohydrolase family protein [Halobaculum sp. XH14]